MEEGPTPPPEPAEGSAATPTQDAPSGSTNSLSRFLSGKSLIVVIAIVAVATLGIVLVTVAAVALIFLTR